MRISVFGANGLTGRTLVKQALAAGHEVVAVTRQPAAFPFSHDLLEVAEADVHNAIATLRAVEGTDAVLSALGVDARGLGLIVLTANVLGPRCGDREGHQSRPM